MRLASRFAIVTALVVAAASPTAAQVVSGGAPNGGASWNIFDDNRTAASFTVTTPVAFDAIRFWGILFDSAPYSPNIFWQILSDAAGGPSASVVVEGNAAAASTLRTALSPGAFSWQFDVSTGMQTLASGVYWLALHDGALDPGSFTGSSLIWETSDAPGAYAVQTFSIDDAWSPGGDASLAFELRNSAEVVATPEPGTFGLIASGLLLTAGVVRTRRRKIASS